MIDFVALCIKPHKMGNFSYLPRLISGKCGDILLNE